VFLKRSILSVDHEKRAIEAVLRRDVVDHVVRGYAPETR